MAQIGFVDVAINRFKWPTNTWPQDAKYKELGAWCFENFSGGLEAITMAPLTRALGWSPEAVRVFLVEVRKSMADKKIHAYWPM